MNLIKLLQNIQVLTSSSENSVRHFIRTSTHNAFVMLVKKKTNASQLFPTVFVCLDFLCFLPSAGIATITANICGRILIKELSLQIPQSYENVTRLQSKKMKINNTSTHTIWKKEPIICPRVPDFVLNQIIASFQNSFVLSSS